ncbi:hypothetical protein ACFL50_05735 [Candidatus Latescibacterota bacterium]
MRKIILLLAVILCFLPHMIFAEMIGNPSEQVGKKNLFVGLEYTSILHNFDLDTTGGVDTESERASLKVTTGLTDWFDIYLKAGGASLLIDYKKESNAIKNFDSNMNIGFGGGGRLRLFNFIDSETRVFIQGGAFYFTSNDDIQWQENAITTRIRDRDIKWIDMYAAIGIVKRIDFIDLNCGLGFSQIKWWINDIETLKTGTATTSNTLDERDSFEAKSPLFGFVGIDFVLPYEYRISAQAGIRNIDEAEFSVAISQGLEQ